MKPKPFVPKSLNSDEPYVRDDVGELIWHECGLRTLYADTDRSQAVYHSNYLKYFEYSRASLMRNIGIPYREIEDSGTIYPIIKVEIDYYCPLYYDEAMHIYTRPSQLERVKIQFDYVILNEKQDIIVCKGLTRHCATNRSGIPVEVDEKTLRLWEKFVE